MPNYDWRKFRESPWSARYPDYALGYFLWQETQDPEELLSRIIQARHEKVKLPSWSIPPNGRPCLFVSHRQDDVDEAERIAYLACLEGYDYWLDIHDPFLSAYSSPAKPRSLREARLVAAAIEMGLLNSTHVIAVMTLNTPGSAWVPYEYGRVKDPVPIAPNVASWVHPAVKDIPEYMHLGKVHGSEDEIRDWLAKERRRAGFKVAPTCTWPPPEPGPL